MNEPTASFELPVPVFDSDRTIDEAISQRVSKRTFAEEPVSLDEISRLLWAAQGITHRHDDVELRAAPSAGATFPMTVFLEVDTDSVGGLSAGVYRYDHRDHRLEQTIEGSIRTDLAEAVLGQPVVQDAPIQFILAAEFEKTVTQYPHHGERYVHMEAGHIAQNMLLMATGYDLNACPVGSFRDDELASLLQLPHALDPLYIVSVGQRG